MMVPGRPAIALDVAGQGEAVVFLHGIGGNRGNWRDQLAAVGQARRVAAWDARGYGGSGDYEGPFTFADACADLLRVLDALGAAQACLVGLSMGGRIALDFYRRHPARVGALVLADTSAGSADSRDPAKIEAFLALRRRPLVEEGKTPADIAPDLARSLAGPHASPGTFERIQGSLAALRAESYLKTLEGVTKHHDFPPFGSIAVPTLVINGEHDRIAPPAMGQAMAAAIPNAAAVVIPGAGHLSNIEQPAAFDAALLSFLRRHW